MTRNPELDVAPASNAATDGDPRSSGRRASGVRLAALGRLAAGVAHEINNPLAYVLGSIELLERALDEIGSLHPEAARTSQITVDAQATLRNAKVGIERIRGTVKDLTSFARAAPVTRSLLDVERAIDSALALISNELLGRLQVVRCFGGVPELMADQARLVQVFVNLILNAARSVPDGRQGCLTISTFSEGGNVCIRFEDDGVGIARDDLPYVFDPFFCAGSGWARPQQSFSPGTSGTHRGSEPPSGAGLGLAICRNVVTGLGGAINVVSEPNAGARFTVTLQAAGVTAPVEGKRARTQDRVNNRARILIIDDEPLLGQTLRFAFQDKHDVDVASSGREALERLASDSDWDLVLCDLMMPDVSGEHVYQSVKQHSPELLPRFVFMTGGAFTERAQEFLASFRGRQLEKPFNIDEIEALLSALAPRGAA